MWAYVRLFSRCQIASARVLAPSAALFAGRFAPSPQASRVAFLVPESPKHFHPGWLAFCNQAARPPNFPPRTDSFVQMSLEPVMCYFMHSHHHCGCNNTWTHHTTPPIPTQPHVTSQDFCRKQNRHHGRHTSSRVLGEQWDHIHPSACVHYHLSRSAGNFGLHNVQHIIQLKQLLWACCWQQTEAGIPVPVDLIKKKGAI